MQEDHTMKHFRKVRYSRLFERMVYDQWQGGGRQGASKTGCANSPGKPWITNRHPWRRTVTRRAGSHASALGVNVDAIATPNRFMLNGRRKSDIGMLSSFFPLKAGQFNQMTNGILKKYFFFNVFAKSFLGKDDHSRVPTSICCQFIHRVRKISLAGGIDDDKIVFRCVVVVSQYG